MIDRYDVEAMIRDAALGYASRQALDAEVQARHAAIDELREALAELRGELAATRSTLAQALADLESVGRVMDERTAHLA